METRDETILARLKDGDTSAYEVLFKKYYKLLSMQAFYILEDEMEAEDVVQMLFSEIWEKQLYYNISSSVRSYLQTAVRNRSFKVLEKRKTIIKNIHDYAGTIDDTDYMQQPDEYEPEISVSKVLNELPRQRQQAFHLVYVEEKRYKEAAEEMGITVNSVKTHLKLAIRELRKRLNNIK